MAANLHGRRGALELAGCTRRASHSSVRLCFRPLELLDGLEQRGAESFERGGRDAHGEEAKAQMDHAATTRLDHERPLLSEPMPAAIVFLRDRLHVFRTSILKTIIN